MRNWKKKSLIASGFLVIATLISGLSLYIKANAVPAERVIRINAKKFDFTPETITLKKGEPVVLEISSADRKHGFKLDAFGIRADVNPGAVTRVRLTPDKTGKFTFTCDVFCGDGHEEMSGTVVVTE